MDSGSKASSDNLPETGAAVCPLTTPLLGPIPGLLAVASDVTGLFFSPLFFGLAGGLLAVISLLTSPPRCRALGLAGLVGSILVGAMRLL